MIRIVVISPIFVLVSFLSPQRTWAQEKVEYKYVGITPCKMCHSNPKLTGGEYPIWEKSLHALAYETLGGETARAIATERGIADPQEAEECLECHVTAYGVREDRLGPKYKMEEGVQCESCHGPGGGYSPLKVMRDHELAVSKGLVIPDEETCRGCHNERAPTFAGFDFDESWAKIAHGKKAKG